jgi:branched-chain amino acid transport system permease protein
MMPLLQDMLNGFRLGSIYALLAVGIVLIYKSSEVLNFAHGALAVFATFIAYELSIEQGLGVGPSIVIALIAAFAIGAAIYRGMLDRATRGGGHAVVMVTIALLMILEGVSGALWGTTGLPFQHYFEESEFLALPGGLALDVRGAWVIGSSICMALALGLFFRFTRTGIALRAVSQNPVAAQLMGVRVSRVHALTWGLAASLAAVAGILVAPEAGLSPSMLFFPLTKAFAAAVLGGMTSITGAILGAWLLGVSEVLVGAYISTEFQGTLAFVIIIAVLAFRPQGLLGTPEITKV